MKGVYLSLGNVFHLISLDNQQNISVTRYHPKTKKFHQQPPYTYALWPTNSSSFMFALVLFF